MQQWLDYLRGAWISYACPLALAVLALFGDRVLHQTEPGDSNRWWKHAYAKLAFVAAVLGLTIVSMVFQHKQESRADALAASMQTKLDSANAKIQQLEDETIQRNNAEVAIRLWRQSSELALDMMNLALTPERGLLEGATTLIENVGDASHMVSPDKRVPPEMLNWIDNYFDTADAYCGKLSLTVEGYRLLLVEAGVEIHGDLISEMARMTALSQDQLKKMRAEVKSSRLVIPRTMRGKTQMLLSSAECWHDIVLMLIQLEHLKRLNQSLPVDNQLGTRESPWARSVMNLTTRPAEVINATGVNPGTIGSNIATGQVDKR